MKINFKSAALALAFLSFTVASANAQNKPAQHPAKKDTVKKEAAKDNKAGKKDQKGGVQPAAKPAKKY
ncbi:hypothetical protein [Pedobacter nutrimenti]|jgi:hypothetical protein|uniref:Uncharacterized protein n=1 Tax=Pedobacter nutrimenti TaxID=1241337 RepID=A0A318UTN3_9SPHI|nr:hypothetical protein [Pedobacter nutrimenti]PYF74989.1 hypothetical protein B0O44_103435 [Pedobacter nutrimenti]